MCGRFSLFSGRKQLQEEFKFMNDVPSDYSARYNIAPQSQILSIIQGENGDRRIGYLHWALLSPYQSDPMMADQVSTIVNNPRNDEAECVKPIN
ncbi:hypothetical protein BTR22_10980 [Alkalihalophilus pseudofirmus]|uniref:SOS response-associated peptidase family protein n=1 Tax=Alkalihalophilus pseudofirmus TaxID=79885 RepID=UPI0009527F6E|nr:hypothetical protein BTR22_10980 [Alkalihalophilus pseudofirmus]